MVEIKSIIDQVGDTIPEITDRIMAKISESGFVAGNISSRLLTILVILGIAWSILSFSQNLKKPIAWLIKVLAVVLIASIIISTFII